RIRERRGNHFAYDSFKYTLSCRESIPEEGTILVREKCVQLVGGLRTTLILDAGAEPAVEDLPDLRLTRSLAVKPHLLKRHVQDAERVKGVGIVRVPAPAGNEIRVGSSGFKIKLMFLFRPAALPVVVEDMVPQADEQPLAKLGDLIALGE